MRHLQSIKALVKIAIDKTFKDVYVILTELPGHFQKSYFRLKKS